MGRIIDLAFAVADHHVGVMVFAVRNPRRGIDEGHGLVIILEFVRLGDNTAPEFPAFELREQLIDLVRGERRYSAFAWLAGLAGQIRRAHGVSAGVPPWVSGAVAPGRRLSSGPSRILQPSDSQRCRRM